MTSGSATRHDASSAARLFESIACSLSSASVSEHALEKTLAIVANSLGFDTGWLWLFDAATQRPYLAASYELPPYLREPLRMAGETCWCIESLHDGDFAQRAATTIECSRLRGAFRSGVPERATGHRQHASVVLRFGERELGLLNLSAARAIALDEETEAILAAIGAQLGIAVERARLADESAAVARSEERTRAAREIHDTLAQDLTAIALQIENAERNLDRDPARARIRLESALAVTRAALDRARSTMVTLRADPLAGRPLGTALGSLVRAFTAETGIVASYADTTQHALPYSVEIELYRIAGEALNNVRAHAQAHRVDVSLVVDPSGKTLELAIADDGIGSGTKLLSIEEKARRSGRFGVCGMHERAAGLGGTFEISARNDHRSGTCVSVRVPLAKDAAS